MKLIKFIFLLIPVLFIFSCVDSKNNKLIIGKWSAVEWSVDDSSSNRNAAATHFSFDDKGKYTFTYAGNEEKGTYKVENDMLFTKPTNQQEIMVKIAKLTQDSLVFDMNRGGQAEILTLLRDK